MTPFDWIDDRLEKLDAAHLRRQLVTRRAATEPTTPSSSTPSLATIDIAGQLLVNFSSNDYLGLARDPRLAAAANRATEQFGWGAGASPLITGHSELHHDLERALAQFEQAESAVLFPTGFAANVGAITALAQPQTHIYSDAKNHASIIDGCRLSGATVHVYRHNDLDHLTSLLKQSPVTGEQRSLIVTDTLFSMDGDLAPLPELTRLAETHGAMLLADEAHATGVLGTNGRGACEHSGVESSSVIRVGTMSKALGSLGGFVLGPRKVIDWMVNRSRTLIYSTAAPPAICAAGLSALEIVRSEPDRRVALLERSAKLRSALIANGWDCGDSPTQIIPIRIGDPETTMAMSRALRDKGFLVPGIRPPSVPEGESLLRISLSYDHKPSQLEALVAAIGSR